MATPNQPTGKSMFAELLLNIVIPTSILIFLRKDTFVGEALSFITTDDKTFSKIALVLALAFPIIYGCVDFLDRRKVNFFSILGVISITLTGGMGLLEIAPKYIAIKEAAIPGILGLLTVISLKTPYPFVRTMLFNENIMQVDRINAALEKNNSVAAFEKSLVVSTLILAGSFLLSATTNYFLAVFLLVSEPGTEQFNEELGQMIALSIPVNSLPAFLVVIVALIYTYKSIKKHTQLGLEEIFNVPEEPEKQETN